LIVKDGVYVGSLCSLIVKHNNIQVVVSDEQIELLKHYKNYDFHFKENGDLGGTGCGVAEPHISKGNKVDNIDRE